MSLHLIKLCVGASHPQDLEAWVAKRVAANKKSGRGAVHDHVTRMRPRRESELLAGGSLYWVMKGAVRARQRIIGLEDVAGADGIRRTAILLEPPLVLTAAQPRRAFQGWRYLTSDDAPEDLKGNVSSTAAPPELTSELANLGLL
ncbi:MAG: DUF1489 domain-containing protein [Pseudomonadota bacterium]